MTPRPSGRTPSTPLLAVTSPRNWRAAKTARLFLGPLQKPRRKSHQLHEGGRGAETFHRVTTLTSHSNETPRHENHPSARLRCRTRRLRSDRHRRSDLAALPPGRQTRSHRETHRACHTGLLRVQRRIRARHALRRSDQSAARAGRRTRAPAFVHRVRPRRRRDAARLPQCENARRPVLRPTFLTPVVERRGTKNEEPPEGGSDEIPACDHPAQCSIQ